MSTVINKVTVERRLDSLSSVLSEKYLINFRKRLEEASPDETQELLYELNRKARSHYQTKRADVKDRK